jgi:acyl-CoA thioesterase-2
MDPKLADLLGLIDLERIEANIFRGESRDIGTPQVFGGQVLGQALAAAGRTIDGREVHSLHAYFLRRGDVEAPIVFEVERARDGSSFSNRRVVAVQHGRQIFNMTASFQVRETGLEHAISIPDVPGPDNFADVTDVPEEKLGGLPERVKFFLRQKRPFYVRPVVRNADETHKMEPVKFVWMKAVDQLPDDPRCHQALLAYMSDYELLGTATLPHGGGGIIRGELQMASLDHAMWFHRAVRVDEWLLFAYDSPSASGSRGLARGQVFNQAGALVASTAQEGLIRVRDKKN